MIIKADEVWTIRHVRKGVLTVRFLDDTDIRDDNDTFAQVQIVAGRATYYSRTNRILQIMDGIGTPGDIIGMRISMIMPIRKEQENGTQ